VKRRIVCAAGLGFAGAIMLGAASPGGASALDIPDHAPIALIILLIALATFVSEDLTVIATGVLIASGEIDFRVGLAGCFLGIAVGDFGLWALGRFVGRRVLTWPIINRAVSQKSMEKWGRVLDTHMGKAIMLSRVLPGTRLPTYIAAGILGKHTRKFVLWMLFAVGVWTPFLLVVSLVIGKPLLGFFEGVLHGWWAVFASLFILYIIVRLIGYEATDLGRQRLKADLKKIVAHEFWPFWFFYLPLVPWLIVLSVRHRPMSFTCVNPGIRGGGGVVGESKSQICAAMRSTGNVAHSVLVRAGGAAAERAENVIAMLEADAALGGYPVVLKPDASERGIGLRIAKSGDDVREYFRENAGDVQVQAYCAGPIEVGVLWSRVPPSSGRAKVDDWPGEMYSITRKTFPVITGDGRRTLEELIWHHPRHRCQADVFLKRFADRTDEVLDKGQTLQLGAAGNHSQGTMFSDGSDLLSDALAEAFEKIAQGFKDAENGAGLDFGRFDVRAASEDDLRAGKNFTVIELNGVLSESTNLYDPSRSVVYCYRVMFAQWRRVFRLGSARRAEGVRPLGVRELVRMVRAHRRAERGSAVSD